MKEFEFIDRLKNNLPKEDGVLSIGDDAAKIGNLLVAKDILVENIHFLPSTPIDFVIHKLFASNISDICAMGGVAKYALLGLGIPENYKLEWELIDSIKNYTKQYDITLLGGDTTGSKKDLFLSLTIIGYAGKSVLLRSGAKPGDLLFVSRPLGLSRISLEKELGKNNFKQIHKYSHYMNRPEVELAKILSENNFATSCIDISDGLGRDAGHISEESNVGVIIEEENIPIHHLTNFPVNPVDYFLSSGEEFALLFTVDPESVKSFLKESSKIGVSPICLGYITEEKGVYLKSGDLFKNISQQGYEHNF